MTRPQIAILVSAFERPEHLRRSLLSIMMQRDVQGAFEVVVTDDGSCDETRQVVERFRDEVDFPVKFTTHPHDGFRLSRCRNEGAKASSAPYLLFTDGDCVLPPDHIRWHLEFRRPGSVIAGDCYRLDRQTTEEVNESTIRGGEYLHWIPRHERRRVAGKAMRAGFYQCLRIPMLPRLTGCNIGIWREDYERVNGFDENYIGWGLEDRDLQLRLSRIGVRCKSIVGRTVAFHLWHPPHPTFARNGEGTANLSYYRRNVIPTSCLNGLVKRKAGGLSVQIIGDGSEPPSPAPSSMRKAA